MADISSITLPSGTTYNIKDAVARQSISGAIVLRGTTTTALTDEATTNPITIDGESYTAVANDAVFYGKSEFVFDGTKWHEFGDMSGLGALAKKDSASGTYTPAGTVSQPTFTGTSMSITGSITPQGTIAVNASSGTGTSYTPQGSIAVNASSGSGTSYTPEGSVGAPTISVKTAGNTTSVTPFGTAGTLPTLTTTVSNENLTISFSQGTLPTAGSAVTVKTGDAEYEASAPSFTGTEKKLAFSGTENKFAFTGTESSISATGTPEGTVSQPSFTGTEATITVS